MQRELKKHLIQLLVELGYEHLYIENENDLFVNLKKQLESINEEISFTDTEWERFFRESICPHNEDYKDKLIKLQGDGITKRLRRDNGDISFVTLLDRKNIHNNKLQFIDKHSSRELITRNEFVTILLGGFPLVHIELASPVLEIKEAFNAISDDWKRDVFGATGNFFDYIQLFVLSNGKKTKYFSCTTWSNSLEEKLKRKQEWNAYTNNSYLFTSYWSDDKNNVLDDLSSFSKSFFEQKNVREILMKYSVLASQEVKGHINLKILRPYQLHATKKIIDRIIYSSENKLLGIKEEKEDGTETKFNPSGGYIWHATGSGKTLTSFKVGKLASQLPGIDKVLFIVDRKDLDIQTQKEYVKFERDATQGTKSTYTLRRLLNKPDAKFITTTIQKLYRFIDKCNKNSFEPQDKEALSKHCVLIFDECHRSHFSKMHLAIKSNFTNSHLFGLTGTPIMPAKSSHKEDITTQHLFGDELHKYTLFNAIEDENVLKFRIDFLRRSEKDSEDSPIVMSGMSREQVGGSLPSTSSYVSQDYKLPEVRASQKWEFDDEEEDDIEITETMSRKEDRIRLNVEYILKVFDKKTGRLQHLDIEQKRLRGHNSMLTVSSIELAKRYYSEFKKQLSNPDILPSNKLSVFTIYTSQEQKLNEDENEENVADVDVEDMTKDNREFLEEVIEDYNKTFAKSFKISNFYEYYQDVSQKVKSGEIDLLIVVDMFLTGFDAPCLNTLWVDRYLRKHGLVQAFSRTNRIWRDKKTHGNIICFRTGEKNVRSALKKYAGVEGGAEAILLLSFYELFNGYYDELSQKNKPGYKAIVERLCELLPPNQIDKELSPEEEEEFVKTHGDFLRKKNIIRTYDEFEGNELVDQETEQKWQAKCIDICDKNRSNATKRRIDDKGDALYAGTLNLIKDLEVTLEYIISIVISDLEWQKLKTIEDKEKFKSRINAVMNSSVGLRPKREIINDYIERNWDSFQDSAQVTPFNIFIDNRIEKAINELINQENLNPAATKRLMARCFRNKEFWKNDEDIEYCVNVSRKDPEDYLRKMKKAIKKLEELYDIYKEFVTEEVIYRWLNE